MPAGSMEPAPVEALFAPPAHAYTLGLLRSLPEQRRARQPLRGHRRHAAGPAGAAARLPLRAALRFATAACTEARAAA